MRRFIALASALATASVALVLASNVVAAGNMSATISYTNIRGSIFCQMDWSTSGTTGQQYTRTMYAVTAAGTRVVLDETTFQGNLASGFSIRRNWFPKSGYPTVQIEIRDSAGTIVIDTTNRSRCDG